MKRCPGTLYTDCDHKMIDSKAKLCDDCIKSLKDWQEELQKGMIADKNAQETALTTEFLGATVSAEKMKSEGWLDQSPNSTNRFFGLPSKAGLWVKLLECPPGADSLFYLLLQTTELSKVKSINTAFFHIHSDGTMCPTLSSILGPDVEDIRKVCREVCMK